MKPDIALQLLLHGQEMVIDDRTYRMDRNGVFYLKAITFCNPPRRSCWVITNMSLSDFVRMVETNVVTFMVANNHAV